jgi:lipid-A-disaccharide synthase
MEVRQLLPNMILALGRLDPVEVNEVVLVEAPGVSGTVDAVLERVGSDPRLRRVSGAGRRAELRGSVAAWTASGTATLECALLGVPMVVGYRLEPLSYAVARLLVRVPHVALVNLIAGRRVAPELLQAHWNPDELTAATRRLLDGEAEGQREALAQVRHRLGGPGASSRAADAVEEHLGARAALAPER